MHLLEKFIYCPVCGSAEFEINDEKSKRCKKCGFTFYINASAATAAFIINDRGELLVARRALEPAKGSLDLPGGFVDPGESITDGMLREVKEETGAEGIIESFLFSIPNFYEYSGFVVPTTDAFFEVRLKDESVISANDDCENLSWIPLSEVKAELFGLNSISKAVEQYLKNKGL